MELRHINSFLVLAEELHFGRSAARLHISQPSLSLQLQQLERRLGVRLVARTSHSVRLTPAGEAFRKEAKALLGQLDRAVDAARQAAPAITGRLRIGFNFPAGQRVLVPTLALMRDKYPDVHTSLLPRHTCGQLAELLGGRLDIAFVYGTCAAEGIRQRPILTLPIVGLCASDHGSPGTIQTGLALFLNTEGASPGPLLAAATLATLPVLAVYAIAARRITNAFMHSGSD